MREIADLLWPSLRIVSLFQAFVTLGGCGALSQFSVVLDAEEDELPHDSTLAYSVFLLGDGGAPRRDGPDPTLEVLKYRLAEAGEH